MMVFDSSYSALDDNELLRLLQLENNTAFTEIYNRYWDKIYSIAAHKLHNLTEAEEVVQDIFLEIWNRRKTLQVTTSLPAYLATAVKYKVINILAARNRHLRYQEHAVHTVNPIDGSTEQWIRFEELQERLAAAVRALPEKCRLVFQLSREEGLSHKEIAETVGISEKTVEAHLTKALRTLRTELRSLWVFFPGIF